MGNIHVQLSLKVGLVVQEYMLFKDFSISSSIGHLVWQSLTVKCAILVEQYGIH